MTNPQSPTRPIDAQTRYVFWVYSALYPNNYSVDMVKCVVDQDKVCLEEDPPIEYPLEEIADVVLEDTHGARNITFWAKLTFRQEAAHVYMRLVNPLQPQFVADYQYHETQALVNTVSSMRLHQHPDVDPNPYHRQLKADHKAVQLGSWDINTSPAAYYAAGRVGLKPSALVFRLITAVGVTTLIVSLIALLTNILSGTGPFWR